MNDQSWRLLLSLELQNKLTRVVTTAGYGEVVAWARENTRPYFDFDDNCFVYHISEDNRGTHALDEKRTITISYMLGETLMIYAGLTGANNLVWFKHPNHAVLFRLSTT